MRGGRLRYPYIQYEVLVRLDLDLAIGNQGSGPDGRSPTLHGGVTTTCQPHRFVLLVLHQGRLQYLLTSQESHLCPITILLSCEGVISLSSYLSIIMYTVYLECYKDLKSVVSGHRSPVPAALQRIEIPKFRGIYDPV